MKRSLKTFTDIDGKKYKFNAIAFNNLYKDRQKKYKDEGKPEMLLRQDMSTILGVSPEAIKSWRYMYNGPADMDLVRCIAKYFSVDYTELLFEPEDETMNETAAIPMKKNTNTTINTVDEENKNALELYRKMYKVISELCDDYDDAWGYGDGPYDPGYADYFTPEEVKEARANQDKEVAKCLDLANKTNEEIMSYSCRVSSKTLLSCYELVNQLVSDIFFMSENAYKESYNESMRQDVEIEDSYKSSWYSSLNDDNYHSYFGSTFRTYYEKLLEAFSDYPKR